MNGISTGRCRASRLLRFGRKADAFNCAQDQLVWWRGTARDGSRSVRILSNICVSPSHDVCRDLVQASYGMFAMSTL